MASKAESYLRDKLKTEVRIGKFRTDFRHAINLDGVYLQDQKRDTLLSVGHLGVDLDIWALLHKQVNVSNVELNDGRVRKAKGIRDAGNLALTVARDPSDAGQDALIAAEGTSSKYAFKVTYPDRLTAGGADGIDYFRALVMSKRNNVGSADNVIRRSFQLGIDSAIISVDPT